MKKRAPGCLGYIPWAPKQPTFLEVSMLNNLVFRWPKPLLYFSWFWGVMVQDEILTQLCGDYFINHKDPYSPPRIQWKVGLFFFFSWLR